MCFREGFDMTIEITPDQKKLWRERMERYAKMLDEAGKDWQGRKHKTLAMSFFAEAAKVRKMITEEEAR
jgi:hypothetical protein